jgi:putative heme-binding domain-containing protein
MLSLVSVIAGLITGADAAQPDSRLIVRDGLELWLDAERLKLPANHATVAVAEWPDESGKGRHVRQTSDDAKPKRLVRNGGAVVRFDGQDDHLRRTGLRTTASDLTVFLVAAPKPNFAPFAGLLAFSAAGQRDYTSGLNIDLGPYPTPRLSVLNVEGAGFGGVANLRTAESPYGRFHLFELSVSGDEISLWIDGRKEGARARRRSSISLDEATVGARYFNNGPGPQIVQCHGRSDIAEVLVYGRSLTSAQRDSTRKYLLDKHRRLLDAPPEQDSESEPFEAVRDAPAVQVLMPGFEVRELPLRLSNLNNVKYRQDGTLVALGYNGDIWLCRDSDGDGLEDRADKFWDNKGRLRAPIGMDLTPPNYPHGQGVFVAAKGKCSLIVDADGDGKAEREIVVAGGWKEFVHNVDALGVAFDPRDGSVYFGRGAQNFTNPYLVEKDGKARYRLRDETGCILRASPDFKSREIVATGVRFSVALRFNRNGDLFATDQEGATWLSNGNPFDELLQIEKGRHYGFPPRHARHLPNVIDEPSVFDYAPQHQSTCGLNFNEPVKPGGPTFGPSAWEGDAIVTGYSRGKLYRTKLVKTPSGSVAKTWLFACLQMLTVDACISPDGSLVVACHSGGPDWGSGPEGKGRLYKITYARPTAPQASLAYAVGSREVRVEFDRPINPESVRALAQKASLVHGPYTKAGDRFESLWPGYAVVQGQKIAARRKISIHSAQLTPDRRSLVLATDPVDRIGTYALQLPDDADGGEPANGNAIHRHPEIDLDFDLSGCEATWASADGRTRWTGWLPHLDLAVSQELTVGSAIHESLWTMIKQPGELSVRTLLDLKDMLRPAVQPGATIDYAWPTETVKVEFIANGRVQLGGLSAGINATNAGDVASISVSAVGDKAIPVELKLQTGGAEPTLHVRWSTNEDARHRSLPLRRMLRPWARMATEEPLAPFALPKEIVGGSWARGRDEFFGERASCSKCHTIHGEGGGIGPDLSNLMHRDYQSVFRDVTQPSFALNPDHLTYSVLLKDGRSLAGVLRSDGDRVKVGDEKGNIVEVDRGEIESVKASNVSTMPVDLLKPLGDVRTRDLFAYLLSPPPSMPRDLQKGRPKPRPAAEVHKILSGAPNPPDKTRPIHIVLTAGPKDHGPGEHDYPAWQKAWKELLSAAKDATIDTAWEWPTIEQIQKADVVVLYQHGDWNAKRAAEVDAFLERGGGLVLIHWAVDGRRGGKEFAQRIGLAGMGGVGFRHGEIRLDFAPQTSHPVLRNFDKATFVDESYWKMAGDLPHERVLATSVEDGSPRPQLWSLERGQGRVFVSIPGHYSWTFDDPMFRVLLLRGIAWSAKEPVDRFNDLVWPGADVAK